MYLNTQLQEQVNDLTKSLENVKTLLSKYETNQQNDYAIGIGLGNNGVAINADVKKTWLYLDKDTVAIGIKYKF